MPTITPKLITEPIHRLCDKLCSSTDPIYISVMPEKGAEAEHCFINVAEKVKKDRGRSRSGWQIWEWVDVLVEAEFHAAWESPDGKIIDITPKKGGEHTVLFLPDPAREWRDYYVDNVRIPLRKTPLFDDLEVVSKRLVNLYNRSDKQGTKILMDKEAYRPLEKLKSIVSTLLNQKAGVDARCPCGSDQQYKKCHRKFLRP